MPGICGVIQDTPQQEDNQRIQAMVKSMMHETFYVSGTYFNENMNVKLGWVCQKSSFSDCLPVANETKDVFLVFSGESFCDNSELEELKAKGHQFNKMDASYIVHMYEEMGLAFLERLNGWFSGVVIDVRERKVVAFNDRYGLSRIYTYEDKSGVYFASEAKCLLGVFPELRQLDMNSVGEFLSYGYVLENRSIFKGISVLPSGSVWTLFPSSSRKKRKYFAPEDWSGVTPLSEGEYYKKLRGTFSRILPRYFAGRERVGISLTGGIDTRMIMAWAPLDPYKVPCYTFSGMYRECADAKIARKVAEACQQWHETIVLNRKFFSEFPALAKRAVYFTDGAMDVSGAVDLFVNKLVRGIAPVRVTGNYGDQVVRRVMGFKPSILWEGMLNPEFSKMIKGCLKKYYGENVDRGLSTIVFRKISSYFYGRLALEQTQLTMRSPFLDNDLVALAFRAPPESFDDLEISLRLIADGNRALSKIPTDRGVVYQPLPLLNKARRVYEEFSSKAEYAYDYGMPEWVRKVDQVLGSFHLERRFLGQHKFYHFRVWYRDELSKYVKDILLDARTLSRPYLSRKGVENVVNSHTLGEKNFTLEIHWLLTIELIQRNLIERK